MLELLSIHVHRYGHDNYLCCSGENQDPPINRGVKFKDCFVDNRRRRTGRRERGALAAVRRGRHRQEAIGDEQRQQAVDARSPTRTVAAQDCR